MRWDTLLIRNKCFNSGNDIVFPCRRMTNAEVLGAPPRSCFNFIVNIKGIDLGDVQTLLLTKAIQGDWENY